MSYLWLVYLLLNKKKTLNEYPPSSCRGQCLLLLAMDQRFGLCWCICKKCKTIRVVSISNSFRRILFTSCSLWQPLYFLTKYKPEFVGGNGWRKQLWVIVHYNFEEGFCCCCSLLYNWAIRKNCQNVRQDYREEEKWCLCVKKCGF